MKYYLIAGEASGDLHASRLMKALGALDPEAQFRCLGGDLMAQAGGTLVKHYREMAYMGFGPVITHLPTIFRNMARCKSDILAWKPDAVVLVDYPGFNLRMARFVHTRTHARVFYYIPPKIWAWKGWRIRSIRRYVDAVFSILPFEPEYYSRRHYKVDYVGNPTAEEVRAFKSHYSESRSAFCERFGLDASKPIVALLAGSRKQEVSDNLPAMAEAMKAFPDYQPVVAGAPSLDDDFYATVEGGSLPRVKAATYALLTHSEAALVTSGTATLETALFGVPQVVCYSTPVPHLARWGFNHILKCPYISLVNLIADREVVEELFADRFSVGNIRSALARLLPGGPGREAMLSQYRAMESRLVSAVAPTEAARRMVELLKQR